MHWAKLHLANIFFLIHDCAMHFIFSSLSICLHFCPRKLIFSTMPEKRIRTLPASTVVALQWCKKMMPDKVVHAKIETEKSNLGITIQNDAPLEPWELEAADREQCLEPWARSHRQITMLAHCWQLLRSSWRKQEPFIAARAKYTSWACLRVEMQLLWNWCVACTASHLRLTNWSMLW